MQPPDDNSAALATTAAVKRVSNRANRDREVMRPPNIPATARVDLIAGSRNESTRVLELGRVHPLKGGPLMGRPWAAAVAPLAALAFALLPARALAWPLAPAPAPAPAPAASPAPPPPPAPDAEKKPDAPAPGIGVPAADPQPEPL